VIPLDPDLVILDFGTNDFLYTERIAPELARDITQTIRWIRQLVPDVTILLTFGFGLLAISRGSLVETPAFVTNAINAASELTARLTRRFATSA